MDLKVLEELGLTDGERKVYKALVLLGKSTTGPLSEESGISHSKVYPILDRLIDKGLASYIVEDNVKEYSPTDPQNLLEYVHRKKEEINRIEERTKDIVKDVRKELGSFEEESGQLYKGFRSLKASFHSILESLKGTEKEFLYIATAPENLTDKIEFFLKKWNQKRVKAGISTRGVSPERYREDYEHLNREREKYELRFIDLETTPATIYIGGDRVIISSFEEEPIAMEMLSSRMNKKYRNFFESLWKNAEK